MKTVTPATIKSVDGIHATSILKLVNDESSANVSLSTDSVINFDQPISTERVNAYALDAAYLHGNAGSFVHTQTEFSPRLILTSLDKAILTATEIILTPQNPSGDFSDDNMNIYTVTGITKPMDIIIQKDKELLYINRSSMFVDVVDDKIKLRTSINCTETPKVYTLEYEESLKSEYYSAMLFVDDVDGIVKLQSMQLSNIDGIQFSNHLHGIQYEDGTLTLKAQHINLLAEDGVTMEQSEVVTIVDNELLFKTQTQTNHVALRAKIDNVDMFQLKIDKNSLVLEDYTDSPTPPIDPVTYKIPKYNTPETSVVAGVITLNADGTYTNTPLSELKTAVNQYDIDSSGASGRADVKYDIYSENGSQFHLDITGFVYNPDGVIEKVCQTLDFDVTGTAGTPLIRKNIFATRNFVSGKNVIEIEDEAGTVIPFNHTTKLDNLNVGNADITRNRFGMIEIIGRILTITFKYANGQKIVKDTINLDEGVRTIYHIDFHGNTTDSMIQIFNNGITSTLTELPIRYPVDDFDVRYLEVFDTMSIIRSANTDIDFDGIGGIKIKKNPVTNPIRLVVSGTNNILVNKAITIR